MSTVIGLAPHRIAHDLMVALVRLQTTLQLMTGLARGGVSYVEVQQVAVTALSAAVAAAGSVFMSTGAF